MPRVLAGVVNMRVVTFLSALVLSLNLAFCSKLDQKYTGSEKVNFSGAEVDLIISGIGGPKWKDFKINLDRKTLSFTDACFDASIFRNQGSGKDTFLFFLNNYRSTLLQFGSIERVLGKIMKQRNSVEYLEYIEEIFTQYPNLPTEDLMDHAFYYNVLWMIPYLSSRPTFNLDIFLDRVDLHDPVLPFYVLMKQPCFAKYFTEEDTFERLSERSFHLAMLSLIDNKSDLKALETEYNEKIIGKAAFPIYKTFSLIRSGDLDLEQLKTESQESCKAALLYYATRKQFTNVAHILSRCVDQSNLQIFEALFLGALHFKDDEQPNISAQLFLDIAENIASYSTDFSRYKKLVSKAIDKITGQKRNDPRFEKPSEIWTSLNIEFNRTWHALNHSIFLQRALRTYHNFSLATIKRIFEKVNISAKNEKLSRIWDELCDETFYKSTELSFEEMDKILAEQLKVEGKILIPWKLDPIDPLPCFTKSSVLDTDVPEVVNLDPIERNCTNDCENEIKSESDGLDFQGTQAKVPSEPRSRTTSNQADVMPSGTEGVDSSSYDILKKGITIGALALGALAVSAFIWSRW